MGYVDEHLLADEVVVYKTCLHWRVYLPAAVFLVFGIISLFTGEGRGPVFVMCIVVAAGAAIEAYIRQATSEFAVTNKRVMAKVGLVSRRTVELLLRKVETVGVEQGILDRMLTSGTIVIAGTGGTREAFRAITDPMEFRKRVHAQLEI